MANVNLTPQMQAFAERLVAEGGYMNVSEVVREGMRRLMEEKGAAFHALKADLKEQMRQSEAGETVEFDPRAWEPDAFKA